MRKCDFSFGNGSGMGTWEMFFVFRERRSPGDQTVATQMTAEYFARLAPAMMRKTGQI